MKKLACLLILLLGTAFSVRAQITYPSAYNLSTGTYTFNNWPATSAAGTYPANMRFYRISNMTESLSADTIYQDYIDAYNITSGTRINGLGGGGFSFINTGNAVYKVGAAILALNTTNRNTIQVTWTGKTVTPNFRTYEVRLYYRVGSSGAWTTVLNSLGDTVRYQRSATAGDSAVKGPVTLPAAANNQPLVQLQWKYFQVDTNTQTGARAELGINNIIVSSAGTASPVLLTGSATVAAFGARVGTNSATDTFTVSGTSLTNNVTLTAPASFQISTSASGPFSSSITLTPTAGTLASTIIYVRFSPTAAGPASGSVSISSTGAGTASVAVSGYGAGYTNPPAHNLAAGDYLMSQWDSLAAAGTYPASMRFHTTTTDTAPLVHTPLVNDWTCPYNLSSRPRVHGLSADGFSFINTGSPQYDNCSSGATALNTFMGAVVLAVNTTGVPAALINFKAGLVSQGDGATPRVYNIRLQYRTDTNSIFTDFITNVEYTSAGKAAGSLESFNAFLPPSAVNAPYIQLRWLYYAVPVSGASGSRPEIRLDEISVMRYNSGVGGIAGNGRGISVYPNPLAAGATLHFSEAVSGKLYDTFGRVVATLDGAKELASGAFAAGVYSLVAADGSRCRIVVQ